MNWSSVLRLVAVTFIEGAGAGEALDRISDTVNISGWETMLAGGAAAILSLAYNTARNWILKRAGD